MQLAPAVLPRGIPPKHSPTLVTDPMTHQLLARLGKVVPVLLALVSTLFLAPEVDAEMLLLFTVEAGELDEISAGDFAGLAGAGFH